MLTDLLTDPLIADRMTDSLIASLALDCQWSARQLATSHFANQLLVVQYVG